MGNVPPQSGGNDFGRRCKVCGEHRSDLVLPALDTCFVCAVSALPDLQEHIASFPTISISDPVTGEPIEIRTNTRALVPGGQMTLIHPDGRRTTGTVAPHAEAMAALLVTRDRLEGTLHMDLAKVRELLAAGEGQRLEFKLSLSETRQAIESLSAFAHADGGTVLFGIAPDGKVQGVSVGANTLENLANDIQRNTQPPLQTTIEIHSLDTKQIISCHIAKAPLSEFFQAYGKSLIRVGRSNQTMSPMAIKQRIIASQRASLILRTGQHAPYVYNRASYTHCRLGVYNDSEVMADNVEISLVNITPRPHDAVFRADYPYRVLRAGAEQVERGCSINPHCEELFEFLCSWVSSNDELILGNLDTKENSRRSPLRLGSDERLELHYRITAANASIIEETILVEGSDSGISLTFS